MSIIVYDTLLGSPEVQEKYPKEKSLGSGVLFLKLNFKPFSR
jgi:hypothetical protein